MTKHYCDRCGNEIELAEGIHLFITRRSGRMNKMFCGECYQVIYNAMQKPKPKPQMVYSKTPMIDLRHARLRRIA